MTNEFMLNVANKLQGQNTRLDECHWGAGSRSIHVIIDEYHEEFTKFKDALMENAQAMFGFIKPGDLNPVLPEAKEFEELLTEIRGMLASIKREASDSIAWSGICNIVDDHFEVVNKYIYLIQITKNKAIINND